MDQIFFSTQVWIQAIGLKHNTDQLPDLLGTLSHVESANTHGSLLRE